MTLSNGLYPSKECPRYLACLVNHCPLDPEQDQHQAHSGDQQQKCPMEKRVRARIGIKYPELLPLGGLTPREAGFAARWSNLTAAQKQVIRDRASEARKHLPAKTNTKRPL